MNKLAVASFTNLGYRWHARRFEFESVAADMTGKTVIVTGASGGLGLESSRQLAGRGARVVMVGRSEERLNAARASVAGDASIEVQDLSLMQGIRQLADRLLRSESRIDVLVNNVGVLLPERRVTSEGLETTFATNLAGHFLLTTLLLPRLAESAPARVVNVGSGGMYSVRIDVDDMQFEARRYTGTAAYANTKRGQAILTEMWAARFPDRSVVFHAMHPGWAATEGVARSLPTFNRLMGPLLRTPEQGADTIVWLAAAEEPGQTSGGFWFDRAPSPTHLVDSTREPAADRTRLWDELVKVTGAGCSAE